jgi:VCBS repeat-containing protein
VDLFAFAGGTVTRDQLLRGPGNHAPQAAADLATVGEDSGLNRIDVLANDRDLDAGDTITVVSVDTSRALGRVVLNSDGTLSYSPDGKFEAMHSGQTATDTFSYTIRDRAGLTSTATVTVTIQGNNDGPVAVSDFTTVVADGSVTIAPLANDTDPDAGDRFTLMSLDTQGMLGSASIAAGNTVIYAPGPAFRSLSAGQSATDTFGYAMHDSGFGGNPLVGTGSVTVTVVGVNDAPDAVGESLSAAAKGATTLGNLLANDSDVDQGDTISLGQIAATSARGATIGIDGDGRAVYDPGDIFAGLGAGETTTDSFSYAVVDSHGVASTATVNLTISGGGLVLDPLLAIREGIYEDESIDLYTIVRERMHGSYGPEAALISVDGTGALGTVSFDRAADSLTYTASHPTLDTLAGDTQMRTSFTYTVRLETGELRTGAVTMTVAGVSDAPTAVDDAIAVQEGEAIDLWNLVRENDLDPESDSLWFVDVNGAGTLGRVSFNLESRTFEYAADTSELLELAPGETIVDSFTYTIYDYDIQDRRSTATVEVTVTGAGEVGTSMADLAAFEPAGFQDPWASHADLLL